MPTYHEKIKIFRGARMSRLETDQWLKELQKSCSARETSSDYEAPARHWFPNTSRIGRWREMLQAGADAPGSRFLESANNQTRKGDILGHINPGKREREPGRTAAADPETNRAERCVQNSAHEGLDRAQAQRIVGVQGIAVFPCLAGCCECDTSRPHLGPRGR